MGFFSRFLKRANGTKLRKTYKKKCSLIDPRGTPQITSRLYVLIFPACTNFFLFETYLKTN